MLNPTISLLLMSYGGIYSCTSFWTVKGKQEYWFCCPKAKSGNSILRTFLVKCLPTRSSINTSFPEGVKVLKLLNMKKRHKNFCWICSHLSFGNFVSLFIDNTSIAITASGSANRNLWSRSGLWPYWEDTCWGFTPLSDGLNGTGRWQR